MMNSPTHTYGIESGSMEILIKNESAADGSIV